MSRAHNGAIATEELLRAGLTPDGIRARVRRGRLVWQLRGVYTVGDPALVPLARPAAALLPTRSRG